jgi:hypothetical protein
MNRNHRSRHIHTTTTEEQILLFLSRRRGQQKGSRIGTPHRLLLSSILRIDVSDYDNTYVLQHRLRIYSTFILATSLFFWIWAMLNTIHLRRNNI